MSLDGYARHTPVLSGVKVTRALSIDGALLSHVSDAIAQLTFDYQWLEVGDTIPDILDACADALDSWYRPLMIGQMSSFLGTLPDGWLALDGGTYNEADYPELWELLDDQFKNEQASTFTLPDFGGLVLVASGNGYVVGDDGGLDDVALSVNEMPAHTHTYQSVLIDIEIVTLGAPIPYGARLGPILPTGSTGSGVAHENMQPYFTVVMGIFSGRV